MYLLSKKIRETTDIKVVFSGEGADELSGSYLYFHNAPNAEAFQEECLRLVKDVQHFDVLRGDKTTAGNGLEIRVPFFDKEFVREYMSIDPQLKLVRDGCEKYLLRKTFEGKLPDEVIGDEKMVLAMVFPRELDPGIRLYMSIPHQNIIYQKMNIIIIYLINTTRLDNI